MRVFVNNIPVQGCIEGWVEIPDDTSEDGAQEALSKALRDGRWAVSSPQDVEATDFELDKELLQKWELCTPLGLNGQTR